MRPTSSEFRSVSNYLGNVRPVDSKEQEYIQHKEDLVALRPGVEPAFVDRLIEKSLHPFEGRLDFVRVSFPNIETCFGTSLT